MKKNQKVKEKEWHTPLNEENAECRVFCERHVGHWAGAS